MNSIFECLKGTQMLTSNKYPIEVCCVVENHFEIDTDIETVNEYTSNLGLKFKLREYNTWKYTDDKNEITSLPAFHIYFGENYVDTFYPDNILNNIDKSVKMYENTMIERKLKIEAWKKFLQFWKPKVL